MKRGLLVLGAIGIGLLIVLSNSRYAPLEDLQWQWLYRRSAESLLENEGSLALPLTSSQGSGAGKRTRTAASAPAPSVSEPFARSPAAAGSPALAPEGRTPSPAAAPGGGTPAPAATGAIPAAKAPAAAESNNAAVASAAAPAVEKAPPPRQCNVYSGRWVWDEDRRTFEPSVCPFVDEAFKCQENGRPDNDYLKWRWQPLGCELARFNASLMLEMLRNKKLVFIGDSLGRNQWESLVCMLYQGVPDRNKVKRSTQTRVSKRTESYSVYFTDYGAEVGFLRSNFLVAVDKAPGPNTDPDALLLDEADHLENSWNGDILVFNSGHWWNHAKLVDGKCSLITSSGKKSRGSIDVVAAFERAMETWARWVDSQLLVHNNNNNSSSSSGSSRDNSNSSARVFFRGFSPNHFSGGAWNTGGSCINFTRPVESSSGVAAAEAEQQKVGVVERVIAGMATRVTLLNITGLSVFRRDAHVSRWGGDPLKQDCSHWCLPGLPDTWNHLLFHHLLEQQQQQLS